MRKFWAKKGQKSAPFTKVKNGYKKIKKTLDKVA